MLVFYIQKKKQKQIIKRAESRIRVYIDFETIRHTLSGQSNTCKITCVCDKQKLRIL